MSNTKREPLLSDKALGDLRRMVISDAEMDSPARSKGPWLMGFVFGSEKVRTIYEAARAKDAELIQRLVNALDETKDAFELYASCQCDGTGCPICRVMDRAENALFSANEQGLKPTNR